VDRLELEPEEEVGVYLVLDIAFFRSDALSKLEYVVNGSSSSEPSLWSSISIYLVVFCLVVVGLVVVCIAIVVLVDWFLSSSSPRSGTKIKGSFSLLKCRKLCKLYLFLIIVFLMRHQKLNFLSFNAGSKQIEKSGSRSGKESRNLFWIDFNQKFKYS
jgi:hypothetical protein